MTAHTPMPDAAAPDAAREAVMTPATFDTAEQYLATLPLNEDERRQLLSRLDGGSHAERLRQLHALLAKQDSPAPAEDPAAPSVGTRLHWALDEAQFNTVTREDSQQRPRLVTMPPLHRASMKTVPWSTNPMKRWAHRLRRRLFGLRGKMEIEDVKPDSPDPLGHWRRSALLRRLVLIALVIGQTCLATYLMTAVLPYHGSHWLEMIILVLYAILFAWVGMGFWTALMGFMVLLLGKDKYSINGSAAADQPLDPNGRTAILVPICNEDVRRVFAGVAATYRSVERTGQIGQFDFFILSDSNDPDTRVAELEAWEEMCRATNGHSRIFYRRRTHRIKRKSGNVSDWCRRWGANYRYMIVLDADSVMSGQCLVRLSQLMEANPNAGIIQTAPIASGKNTAYARIQQFATRVYGPLFTSGLHFWQLGESHYWGHNAILRVAPFMKHCSLPRLPGDGALGGEILSHDFVEAALMRRAGWSVWIAYDLPGSYEEMPPTLLDELKRDRRWCQGNLQNFRLFFAQGLHPAHRAVFMTGVMAYLSAPLWFIFLVLSTALLAVNMLSEPQYFPKSYQLFPTWPEWHPEWAVGLFTATATLLFLPKLLSCLLILAKPSQWRGYGGPLQLIASVVMEVLFSAILAPIRMLFHTKFVTTALLGWSITWKSPPRDDAETSWTEALDKHWRGSLLGLVWSGLVYWLNPQFLWWLLPVAGSLVFAVPMSVWSSRTRLGRWFRERRFFLIPEEAIPPRELRALERAMDELRPEPADFRAAAVLPLLNAMLVAVEPLRNHLPNRLRHDRDALVAEALRSGPDGLSQSERAILLTDAKALSMLHFQLWAEPTRAHESWQLQAICPATKGEVAVT